MIVGIVGLIGSGKNTVGDILVGDHGYKQESFAKSLKDMTAILFNWDRRLLEGDTEESRNFRETVDWYWSEALGIHSFTPRYALQFMGTEVMRQSFHDDIWVKSLYTKLMAYRGDTVITDVRFHNEMKMIRQAGGEIWHVKRGADPEYWDTAMKHSDLMEEYYPEIHRSEWEWISGSWDHEIPNDKSLEHLRVRVSDVLEFGYELLVDKRENL